MELRFSKKVSGIPYDGKYIFSAMGYNFLPSEISAAFAIEQIKKLKKNIELRHKNFSYLHNFFKKYNNYFELPLQNKGLKTAWLAFPLLIKSKSGLNRKKLQIFLEQNGIQTRTIFTGNILRQPIMKNKKYNKYEKGFNNSDNVMRNGILIGCHHGLKLNELKFMTNMFDKFFKKI